MIFRLLVQQPVGEDLHTDEYEKMVPISIIKHKKKASKIQTDIFWVMIPCSISDRIPTFRRTMLPPSSGRMQKGPPKRRYFTTTQHGVTTQKTLNESSLP